MKKIEMIVPDTALAEVKSILLELGGSGFSYYWISGEGSTPYSISKVKVEVVVRERDVDEVIKKTIDRIGPRIVTGGKIFVSEVYETVDIRRGTRGEAAISQA